MVSYIEGKELRKKKVIATEIFMHLYFKEMVNWNKPDPTLNPIALGSPFSTVLIMSEESG